MIRSIFAAAVALAIIAGCSGATPTAQPAPTPTQAPPATPEPTPAPTATPTAQPVATPTQAPPATPEPTPAPTATPAPSLATGEVRLNVTTGPEALHVLVDVPPTWHRADPEPADSNSVVRGDTLPPTGMFVWFGTLANTYADPCGHVLRTPAVGATVDDLISAFAEIPNLTPTEPVQTTLGGRPATYIELAVDDELPCPANSFYLAADEQGFYFFVDGPGQVVRTWVLDLDGTRVVAWAFHFPEATAEGLAEEQAILDSVEFEPPT